MAIILAIDDDAVNRLLLATLLRPLGHDVREASSGEEGLREIARSSPDLAILDLSMPGMNGAEFLKVLRGDLRSTIRVVLYTATRAGAAMRDFADLFGVVAILEKPSEPADIRRIIEAALAAPSGLTEPFE